MSVLRMYGRIQLECDKCEETHRKSYHNDEFDIMIDDAKEDDWLIIKEDNHWHHYCPQCQ